ncbi:MAG: transporter [Akkermansiaceae bacterium]|nr:transporter [Akkermansiaceae bacterium]
MKNYFYLSATVLVAFTGALSPCVNAGVPIAVCKDCNDPDCTCTDACGCDADGHDYFTHAPIGVMGDHIHRKGGLMASYRYMFMSMQRNYDGDSQISDAAARAGYMASSADMDMQMHMLGVMYAPSDQVTLMLMTNYLDSSMLNINMMGARSIMRSAGWGDTSLSAYYSLYKKTDSSAHIGLGLSAPTGSIDEKMAGGAHMGYPMQLGSGTWDLKPSLTWLGGANDWSYGSQLSAVIHLDENDNGYTLGDSASLTGWVSRRLNTWSAVSLRLTGSSWENVDGHDSRMPVIPMGPLAGQPMAGVADPDARGGSRIDLSLGLNLWDTQKGTRFSIEAGAPVYQNLDGPQLGTEWFVSAGFQFSW